MSDAIIKVGSSGSALAALPDPAVMTVLLQDIDSAGTTRSANGTMMRDRVAGGKTAKRKIELEWPPLNDAKASQILQAIQAVFFAVEYPDPYEGGRRTAVFYAGDRSLPMYHHNLNGQGVLWEGLKVNLIEK